MGAASILRFRSLSAVAGLVAVCGCSGLLGRGGEPVADPCGVRTPPADTLGWVRILGSGITPSFLLPPGFARDTGRLGYWHGGMRWSDGRGRVLERVRGHWGEGSFRSMTAPPGAHAECSDTIAGEHVILTTARRHEGFASTPGQYSVYALFPERRSPIGSDVLIGSGPRRADQEFFLALIRTARFLGTPQRGRNE